MRVFALVQMIVRKSIVLARITESRTNAVAHYMLRRNRRWFDNRESVGNLNNSDGFFYC